MKSKKEGTRGPRDTEAKTHSRASRKRIRIPSREEAETDIPHIPAPPTSGAAEALPPSGTSISESTRSSLSDLSEDPPPEVYRPPVKPPVDDSISLTPPPYDFIHCKTRTDRTGPYVPEDVIAAIRATKGNFLEMSALLGRRRNAIRDYVYANIEIKDVWDETRESFLDEVEQATHEIALIERDPPTLRFLLTTLAKDRGYTPKVEHGTTDGRPFQFEVSLAEGTNAAMDNLTKKQTAEQNIDKLLTSGIEIGGKS